jgi:methionyl-tRNA synthetase
MSDTYYVTTPIYYVNDVPHIGHAYTTIAADVLARFHRLQNRPVRFLTGTDEHGVKIYKAAREKGTTPDKLGDQVVVHFQNLWKQLDITHDDFIRTTEPRHEQRVRELIRRLLERDEIYLGSYEGWYDEGQEEYVTESAARENEYRSAISGRELVKYSENNWFFRLGKWVPKLIEHIESNPEFIQPDARRNEVVSKLKQGVEDLCISRRREKLPWGVAMPNDDEHVVYVWVDALSNYINALGIPEVGDEHDGEFAEYWPADAHLIGKDILWFHAVYWPCILMALDIPLPRCVFAHGWWTSEGKKRSKSLGNFISREVIEEICDEYSLDAFRYYLLRAMAFGADGDFSRDMFQQRYNTDLANGVGNLLSRTVNMIGRYFDGVVAEPGETVPQAEPVMLSADALNTRAASLMDSFQLHAYLDAVMDLVDKTNKFIEATEPFRLAKDESQRDRLASILYTCAEAVRIVLLYLRPVMPETCQQGLTALGCPPGEGSLSSEGAWGQLPVGTLTEKIEPLFPRKK